MSPLLFVLCMEYFSRTMTYIGKQDVSSSFIPGVNHLLLNTFALLMMSFYFAMVSLNLSSWPYKSDFYNCGFFEQDNTRIKESFGFKHCQLPFRYLGVPISTKKIAATDCEKLIEKMVGKIRVWSTRNISFAGRRQLVNSVLMSITVRVLGLDFSVT